MVSKVRAKAADSISIQALADDARVTRLSPKMAELAARIDALCGDKEGRITDAEVNAFITGHLAVVTEAMARHNLLPEAKRLLARAIALQVRAGEADENAALAKAIDERATVGGKRIGNGDGRLSRREIDAFIKDRTARLKTDAANRAEHAQLIALARRVQKRMKGGPTAVWGPDES